MTRHEARIPFFLLWRQLRRGNPWTIILIISLMAIAFINLVFVSSLFQGIIDGTNKQIIDMSTGHVMILPSNEQYGFDTFSPNALLTRLRADSRVVGAVARYAIPARITGHPENDSSRYGSWTVIATNPDDERAASRIPQSMIEGSFLDASDTNGIVLGRQIAGGTDVEMDAMSLGGAHVGDSVDVAMFGNTYRFIVRGIIGSKFIDTDSTAMITTAALAKCHPSDAAQATHIIVRMRSTGQEKELIESLSTEFPARYYSWEDAAGIMKGVTKSFLSINIILSVVAILIAAVTIFIVVYIDISNKKREIGILRAIGMKPSVIQWTYILQTVFYAFTGMLLGSVIFFGGILPYFIAHPFELPIADTSLSFTPADLTIRIESIFLVSILAGLIPALYFTRMKILDAIWGSR